MEKKSLAGRLVSTLKAHVTTIQFSPEQWDWIKKNHIKISPFVRELVQVEIKKRMDNQRQAKKLGEEPHA